ncbi:MAG: ABC transporter permease [Candidatus Aceula lacicola]|nr:ABC transporter permease [Candidatus Aceula lacicola]
MTRMKTKSKSQFQMAMATFRKNRLAMFCFGVLMILYFSAIFAGFLSPYSYDNENRNYSYCPPMKIHVVSSQGKLAWPYVNKMTLSFDQFHKRVYTEDVSESFSIKLFVKGDQYKILGMIPSSYHLFGVKSPGRLHLWGADSRGRDLFSRLLWGARISLSIGLVGVAISFFFGLLIGGISGYYGGKIDNLIMRMCEMIMMIPGFYLMLALRAAFPPNLNSLQVYLLMIVIFSFIGWASLARVIRGMAISLKQRDYVLAAKAIGLSDIKIIKNHILPHTISYSIVAIMLSIPGYIMGESALSLLGLGIQDPYASWGNLLSEAMGIIQIRFAPWILLPGFFIFLTVICFNIIGDALRDALDPTLKMEGQL